ncbi:hypothetical protein [Nocardioides caldifontis]|uniref:hypothetical protein n=1 Tax=Nocardioides caldifontis TaxID=2588938 RepID=UPI0011DFA6B1|nr:hypothetical protein [Nocardioides caldifontis]
MTSAPTSRDPRHRVPAPLAVAVSLVAVEAVVYFLFGIVEASQARGEALALAVTATLFFVLWGAGLGFCAWNLWRLASWARAPVVLAQLIQVMVGASFWGGNTTVVAVVAIAVAVVALAGIFHPQSLAALEPSEE